MLPEETMQDFGSERIEPVTTERQLVEVARRAESFTVLQDLVRQYNSLFDAGYRHGDPVHMGLVTIDPSCDKVLVSSI